jgi:hypothetical protein
MANALYENYRNLLIGDDAASLTLTDWDTDTIKAHLVDTTDYVVNLSTDVAESDVTDAGIVTNGTATLGSVTAGDVGVGVVDAANTTFTSVTGDEAEAVVLWEDTGGADTTDPLLVYFDTFASGMPVTPNGGDITIQWNASGIFQI